MLVYADLLSDARICSDAYPTKTLANGAMMAVESMVRLVYPTMRQKIERGGETFNISSNESQGDGEDGPVEDESIEDQKVTVINIVEAHSLQVQRRASDYHQQMTISKKEYTLFIKDYYKKLIKV